jgi:hypothetical protein
MSDEIQKKWKEYKINENKWDIVQRVNGMH